MRVFCVTPTFELSHADSPIKFSGWPNAWKREDVKVVFLHWNPPSSFPWQHVISNYGYELSHSSQSRFTRRSGKSDKWQNKLTFLSLNCRQTWVRADTWVTQGGSLCVVVCCLCWAEPRMPQMLPLVSIPRVWGPVRILTPTFTWCQHNSSRSSASDISQRDPVSLLHEIPEKVLMFSHLITHSLNLNPASAAMMDVYPEDCLL